MDVLKDVLAALIAALIIWGLGIPRIIYRTGASFVKEFRLRKRIASSLLDPQAVRNATRFYVRPFFSSVDPSNDLEPSHSLINARSDLFTMIDRFLSVEHSEQKHMLLFADSGMGKTSFLLNYLNHNYRIFNLRKKKILFIPLSKNSADDVIRAVSMTDRAETNLFLDALDEDPRAQGDVIARMEHLLILAESFRTVIITCRSQFFRSDEQIPKQTGVAKPGPVPLGQTKHYNFLRAYLSPFDENQVKDYLTSRFPGLMNIRRRSQAKKLVQKIPSLSVRPMLLAHMPDLLQSNAEIRNSVDVYTAMVYAWIHRESNWVDPLALLSLSELLAIDLHGRRARGADETMSKDELSALANASGVPISSDLVASRSLLNRTGDGRYKFAHRSIMEYFIAKHLIESKFRIETNLTDQTATFLLELLGCWSDEIRNLTANCNIALKFVEPDKRLGLSTSHGLYVTAATEFPVEKLLKTRCATTHSSVSASNLEELISDMAESGLRVNVSEVQDVKIIIGPPSGQLGRTIKITVWMNSYCVIAEAELIRVSEGALDLHGIELGAVMLSASPSKQKGALKNCNWTVSARTSVPGLAVGSPYLANEGVALNYYQEDNKLVISALDPPVDDNPLAAFGIFGVPQDRRPVADRPYGLLAAHLRNSWRPSDKASQR
ncbi:NACHT domain-containing protein [Lysobacter sp. CA196]|uniref:NACHT domain-containing protein n=1 Tax=Lysobacter sp. CA196 TaxID=3455606 RepID=UPI003F8D26DC